MRHRDIVRIWAFFASAVIFGCCLLFAKKTRILATTSTRRLEDLIDLGELKENSVLKQRIMNHNWPEWTLKYSLRPWENATYDESYQKSDEIKKRLPTAICIGAKKCGTTAFRQFMEMHPNFKDTKNPEIHFFDSDAYYNGFEAYRDLMPESMPNDVVFEKSPKYFVLPVVLGRIAEWKRDIKLILVLCNPVARAYSDFQYIKTAKNPSGRLWLREFDTFESHVDSAISDLKQIQENPRKTLGYGTFESAIRNYYNERTFQLSTLTTGMYYYHLKNWYNFFSPNQIHIVDGENLIKNPVHELQKAEKFLELSPFLNESMFHYDATKGFYCAEESGCLGDRKGVTRLGNRSKMNLKTREKLSNFFKPFNEKLFLLLGRRFDWP